MSAKVTPAELLRRGLESGVFDGAPQFRKDAKACLKAPPKLRVWSLSMDGERISDPVAEIHYSEWACYESLLAVLAFDPPEDETEEERQAAQRFLEAGDLSGLRHWISEHDHELTYWIYSAEIEPSEAEVVQ